MSDFESRMSLGACKGADPEIFFPERMTAAKVKAAKEICGTCPLEEDCREYAVADSNIYGVWGKTSDRDRIRIREQRAAAAIVETADVALAEE